MEKDNKKIQDDYEYQVITVFDEDNRGWDYSIDYLMDNAMGQLSKAEKIEYLNDIIHDIEHYRDSL
jgi:hypothetical protein